METVDALTRIKHRKPIRRALRRGEVVQVRVGDGPWIRGTFQGYVRGLVLVSLPFGRRFVPREDVFSRRDRLANGSLIWVGVPGDRWRGVLVGYAADGAVIYYRSGDQRDRRGSNATDGGAEFARPVHVSPRDESEYVDCHSDREILAAIA